MAPEPTRYPRYVPVVPRIVACHRCKSPFRPTQEPYWCPACSAKPPTVRV